MSALFISLRAAYKREYAVISGHPTAYRYLPESVANFPTGDDLARRMQAAGFSNVRWRPLTFGVVAIHVGEREAAV